MDGERVSISFASFPVPKHSELEKSSFLRACLWSRGWAVFLGVRNPCPRERRFKFQCHF